MGLSVCCILFVVPQFEVNPYYTIYILVLSARWLCQLNRLQAQPYTTKCCLYLGHPLAAKCFGGFDGGSKANVGHYKMHLRSHFVVKNGMQ